MPPQADAATQDTARYYEYYRLHIDITEGHSSGRLPLPATSSILLLHNGHCHRYYDIDCTHMIRYDYCDGLLRRRC